MIQVGITGQSGFIGWHLNHYLGLFPDLFSIIPFEDVFFEDASLLSGFVRQCDAIVHLAGVNRHEDPVFIEERNIQLARLLIAAMESTGHSPALLFASSTQEGNESPYARGKEKARLLLAEWAGKMNVPFKGMLIPNVFGPFGKPNYHSVVATFCHQLIHNDAPRIEVDKEISLIYVLDLCQHIKERILHPDFLIRDFPKATGIINVTFLLERLQDFKDTYLNEKNIPVLATALDQALFNTFRSYIPLHSFPFRLELHVDQRGRLAEFIRAESKGQAYFSYTKPGVTRGNHFHLQKIERFCVIQGEAVVRLRKIGTSEVISFTVNGDEPCIIDMPIWYTHNISNTGTGELLTLFWSSAFYDPDHPDTWFEDV